MCYWDLLLLIIPISIIIFFVLAVRDAKKYEGCIGRPFISTKIDWDMHMIETKDG